METEQDAERRGYAKGYAAGRRKKQSDRSVVAREREHRARMDRFMCAAMTGLLAASRAWERAGKPDKSPDDFAQTARYLAEAMMRKNP